eukprot:1428566-Rhodomonas_salina.1
MYYASLTYKAPEAWCEDPLQAVRGEGGLRKGGEARGGEVKDASSTACWAEGVEGVRGPEVPGELASVVTESLT